MLNAYDVYDEVQSERKRAHAKHGDTSMERLPITDMTRLSVLMEEVGEVAREFNDARERSVDLVALRAELIQVAAMATAWADNIGDLLRSSRSAGALNLTGDETP